MPQNEATNQSTVHMYQPPDKLYNTQNSDTRTVGDHIGALLNVSWYPIGPFPQLGRLNFASLTHQNPYGGEGDEAAPAVRDEYAAWAVAGGIPQE
jgi:hypothetical protein